MRGRYKMVIWWLVLGVVAYATYIHGYFLDTNIRLFGYYVLEIIPWWIPGTYLFLPVYWLMAGINRVIPNMSMGVILSVLVIVHLLYIRVLGWGLGAVTQLFSRRKKFK